MTQPDNQVTQLIKGMVTDSNYQNQPDGSWRFALNLVNSTREGDLGYVVNEYGNTQCSNLTIDSINYLVVGAINLLENQVVLFLATSDQSNSAIVIQDGCNLTTVVNTPCLSFSEYHPITGIAKIRRGCNRVIYFRDSYNSDRSIDLDEILNNPSDNQYFDGTWHCELFKMNPDFDFPCIDYIQTNNSGGNLKLGMYQFGVALGDADLNFTGILAVTQPIPITQGVLNTDVNQIEGGNPLIESTNKSIQLQFTNLDQDYEYIKIYVIETIAGVTTPYEAITLAIPGTSLTYVYGGVDANSAIATTLPVINAPIIVYDKSKTMEQQDQRLIKGNLEEKTINHSVWQRAANLIKSRYVTKPIKYLGNSSVFSGDYYVDNRTYMRDEVYAISISGRYKDGSSTSEYHIQGRNLDTSSNGSTLPTNSDPSVAALKHNRKLPLTGWGWDSTQYTVINGETYPQNIGSVQNWDVVLSGGSYIIPSTTEVCVEEVKHLNKVEGDSVQRWEVFNTAYQDELNSVTSTYYSKGQLAYWESDYQYPSTLDCSGNRIYPTGNIRHHKMPDTTLEPHFINNGSNEYIISLGLEFDLVAFKAFLQANLGSEYDDIQGFVISRAKRDKGNKSVFDKGLSSRSMEMIYDGRNYLFQTDLFNKHAELARANTTANRRVRVINFDVDYDNTAFLPDENTWDGDDSNEKEGSLRLSYKKMHVHNPKNKFYSDSDVNYIKCEKELFGKMEYWGAVETWDNNTQSRASFRTVYSNYHPNPNYHGTPMLLFTNRLVSDKANLIQASNTTFQGFNVINATQQEALLLDVDNFPDLSNDGAYYGGGPENMLGGSRRNNDPLNFIDFSVNGTFPTIQDQYSKTYYIALKNYNPTQYNQLHSLTYYPINTCLISKSTDTEVLFGGDCFISQLTFRKTYCDQNFDDLDERTWWQNLISYFVESEINTKLRHENTVDTNQQQQWYYPFHGTTIAAINDVIFRNDEQHADSTDVSNIISKYVDGNYCFNKYNYNQDYSLEQQLRPNFPLNLAYDYCSECGNIFPYRIIYSDKSYQEDLSDAYRRFPVNNYRDLSAATGEIMNIFRESDTLFTRTEQSLWYIPTKQQEIQTSTGDTIQIGTGDFFSLPPKELTSTTIGYNGGQTTLDLVINEYGALYADAGAGIVFLTKSGQGQREISKDGLNRFWFEQNLPFNLLTRYSDFPDKDAPTSKSGIGLIGYYDPINRRYILTKKDYFPIYPDDTVYIDNTHTWSINTPTGFIFIDNPYNSPLYFENKSWTISYSLEDNVWLSFHSYLPNFAWNTRDYFSTYIQNSNFTWRHENGEFQTYYGNKYPHIFEFVVTKDPLNTKIYNTVSYISNVQEYSSLRRQWIDIKDDTFNKGIFYNDSQSTGELDITVKNTVDPFASILLPFDAANILVERTESNWNINNIRDMVDQTNPIQSIFTSDWNSIRSNYFIDKVPNSNIINFLTKPQYEMEMLRDNYLAVRLSYKNSLNNRRIITKYLNNNYIQSIR